MTNQPPSPPMDAERQERQWQQYKGKAVAALRPQADALAAAGACPCGPLSDIELGVCVELARMSRYSASDWMRAMGYLEPFNRREKGCIDSLQRRARQGYVSFLPFVAWEYCRAT